MAWDTERTRQLLLDAAIDEFSAHGFAGARIERISARAGVNRERAYSYFGSKRGLFEAALTARLLCAFDAIPVDGEGPEAVGRLAGAYFDASLADPSLARLVYWESLELAEPVDPVHRAYRAASTTERVAEVAGGIPVEDAAQLLLTIVTLCHSWLVATNLGRIIAGDAAAHARRRASIVRVAELVAADAAACMRSGVESDAEHARHA